MNSNLKSNLAKAALIGSFPLAMVLIHYFEGVRYYPYYDVSGVLTVCYGHTGNDIDKNKRYSQAECDALLDKHLSIVAGAVDSLVKVDLSDNQKAALYSFTYNVGINAFKNSTLLKKINDGKKAEACSELRRWVYADGRPWKGLMIRRKIEEELCHLDNIDELNGVIL